MRIKRMCATAAAMAMAIQVMGGCAARPNLPPPPATADPTGPQATAHLEKAIAVLQESAQNEDVTLRANVMEALQPLKDPRATAMLEAGLREHNVPGDAAGDPWLVRFAAAMTVGKRREMALRPELQQLLSTEGNDNVKVAMVYALMRMGDSSQMHRLGGVNGTLVSADPDVRANTVLVLGLLGDRTAVPVLRQMRDDPDWRVKYEIKAALARLGEDDGIHAITSMALSKVAEEQWNALQLCGELQPEIATSTLRIGLRPDWQVAGGSRLENARRNIIAARGLGKKGIDIGGPWVMLFISDTDPGLRALSALALGDIYKPGQEAPLAPLLDDPVPNVRLAAAAGIVAMESK